MKAVINQNLDEEPSMLMQIDQTLLDRTKKSSAMQRAFCFFPIKHYAILQQINVKNVHRVFGAGIQTHDLLIMSLLS